MEPVVKGMKNKILLGSIIAIVIIILASYTSVVGFQSTQTSKVGLSPLFRIRSKKAIDTKYKDIITSDYIGKGNEDNLQIPTRDNQDTLIQRVIDRIKGMDEKSFDRFVLLLINRFQQEIEARNIDIGRLITILNEIRTDKSIINVVDGNEPPTLFGCIKITLNIWLPGCILAQLIGKLGGIIPLFIVTIYQRLITFFFDCRSTIFVECHV